MNKKIVDDLLYKEECYKIIGICMKIHSRLGKGFREAVYMDALEIEFAKAEIPYEREKLLSVYYENQILRKKFKADFFLYNAIIFEGKSCECIKYDHLKQTLNNLRSTHFNLALVVNFGENKLKFKRIVSSFKIET